MKFFQELQRIALVTGVAETLRDQGVPMPDWMLSYRVDPIPLDRTTPSLTVEDTEEETVELHDGRVQTTTRTLRIYGGVRLAADVGDVRTKPRDKGADATEDAVAKAMQPLPPLGTAEVRAEDTSYRALSLPGSNAREVGANRLSKTDLSVEVVPGRHIALTRKFHSFFQPQRTSSSAPGPWTCRGLSKRCTPPASQRAGISSRSASNSRVRSLVPGRHSANRGRSKSSARYIPQPVSSIGACGFPAQGPSSMS